MSDPSPDFVDHERGTVDTTISVSANAHGIDSASGDADRGTALAISSDLQTAINNLRRCERYTIFLRDGWRYKDVYINNPRPTGKAIRLTSSQYTIEDRETKELLKKVYQSENGVTRYFEDRSRLSRFLTSTAQTIGIASLDRRKMVIKGIRKRYKRDKLATMESLADACARMLVFRTGMPLPFTIERKMYGQSPILNELDVDSEPNTRLELEKISKEKTEEDTPQDGNYEIPSTPMAAPTGLNAEEALAYADAIREVGRQRHIQKTMWHAKWSTWSDNDRDRNTPFDLRLYSIYNYYGIKDAEYHRKQVYLEHPITAVFHIYVDPYELADIIRTSNVTLRNARLEEIVGRVVTALERSRRSMHAALKRDNPDNIDWSQYEPLLRSAAAFIMVGTDDPINSVCEVLYREVDPWTWPDIFNEGLMAIGIISICIFPFASPGVALFLGGLNLALTFPGLGLALQQIAAANEGIRQDNADEQYTMLSGELEILENKESLNGAYVGLFLELLGAMPWGAVIKVSRRSLGLADEAVETAMRAAPNDALGRVDPVRMTPNSDNAIPSSVVHPDAEYQPRIEMPPGPSSTYRYASYAPHIEMPRISAGERLPTEDEISAFLIAKRDHDLTHGFGSPIPPSNDVLRSQARRIRDAETEVIDVLDDMDHIDPPTNRVEMTRHQRYLHGQVRNEEAINNMRGIEMDADGRIIGPTADLPEEITTLTANGARFKVHETSGNLHYKVEGQGWRLVFDELRNPPSNRALAGYSNYRRSSAWYEDLRSLWEMRGYARRTDMGAWEMLDPELKLWIPESHIQMGHVVSAVEHDQMMLRFIERARTGQILDNMGHPLSEARIQEIRRNAVRTFMGDYMNYVPQYKWRNEELGRRIGLRYGRLDPDYALGSSSRMRFMSDGSIAQIWHGDGRSILSWSEDGTQRILTDENGVQRVIDNSLAGPDHLAGKDLEAYYQEIDAIRLALQTAD